MINGRSILSNIVKMKENDKKIITAYNNTAEDIEPAALHEMFVKQAISRGDKVAVVLGNESLTYKQLDEKSNQIANYLREKGVRRNDLVGILAQRVPGSIVNMLGILKAGGGYVPVDPGYPEERRKYILTNSACKLILTPESYDEENMGYYATKLETAIHYHPEDLAYVIYTSGSTGRPKGVMTTHKAAFNTIMDINRKFNVGAKDKVIGISSMCFDLSVYDIFGSLSMGATLVQIPDQRDIFNLINVLEEQAITIWNSVPAIMDMLIQNVDSNFKNDSLRLVLLSGDWIPLKLPEKIKNNFTKTEVISLGGATEAAIWSIYYPIKNSSEKWKSIPYGRPLANQKFYVLNYDMQICPIGVQGELHIGGAGLANGYHNDKEKTDAAFIEHNELGRLYKTGDYGVMHREGYIEFLGRKDQQVKIRGYRIELGEVEACLQEHPSVQSVVVIDRSDPEGKKYLCAYVVPKNELASIEEYRDFILQKLPDYMCPSYFIKIDQVPVTPNGKIDKKSLLKMKEVEKSDENKYEAPSNAVERKLLAMCDHMLANGQKIGINDNFFEIGVDSVLMVQIITDINNEFGVGIHFKDFLKLNNIKELAEFISNHSNQIIHQKSSEQYVKEKSTALISSDSQEQSEVIHYIISERVKEAPDKVAVMYEQEQLTYKELEEKSNQVARYLIDKGSVKNKLIGVIVSNPIGTIVNMLGILKAGGIYLPIDPSCCKNSDKDILYKKKLNLLLDGEIYLKEEISQYPKDTVIIGSEPEDWAYIACSLLNKKEEKWEKLSHQVVVKTIIERNNTLRITAQDKIIGEISIYYESPYDIFAALMYGASIIQVPDQNNIENIMKLISEEKVTIWNPASNTLNMALENLKKLDHVLFLQENHHHSKGAQEYTKDKEVTYYWSPIIHWEKQKEDILIGSYTYANDVTAIFPEFYFAAQKGVTIGAMKDKFVNIEPELLQDFVQDLIAKKILVHSILTPEELFSSQEKLYKHTYGMELLYNEQAYSTFKKQQLNRVLKYPVKHKINLEGKADYPRNISKRRTCREFDTSVPISFKAFSQLLSVFRQYQVNGEKKYYYSSAGGLYPIDVFVYIKENMVRGLKHGLYYYNPLENNLILVNDKDSISADVHYFTNKKIYNSSAFSIFFIYNAAVTMPRYAGNGYFFSCLDTGIMVSTLTQIAELLGIGVCSIGDMNYEKVRKYFGLDSHQVLIHTVEAGLNPDRDMNAINELPESTMKEPDNIILDTSNLRLILLNHNRIPEDTPSRIKQYFANAKIISEKKQKYN